jgi:hypothetical protein
MTLSLVSKIKVWEYGERFLGWWFLRSNFYKEQHKIMTDKIEKAIKFIAQHL